MKNGERLSLEQVRAFLKASEEFRFEASKRKEVYDWVTRTLVEQEYHGQTREAKGVLRQYVGKMTGLSRAQVTRLIGRYQQSGMVGCVANRQSGTEKGDLVLAETLYLWAFQRFGSGTVPCENAICNTSRWSVNYRGAFQNRLGTRRNRATLR